MAAKRDPFKIEFSPLPIPTEPPDAPGGFYFYLSPQWAAYARGMLSYLGMRRFWQDAPEQYDQILQWVYQLLEEISLPTDTIEVPVEVPIYLRDWEEEEADECGDDYCMCVKCGTAVHFDVESKKKYILDANCNKVYIDDPTSSPELAGIDDWVEAGQPPLPADLLVPHDNPLYQNNTEAQKCAKATAIIEEVWNLMSVHEAIEGGMSFSTMVTALIGWAAVQFPAAVPANLAAA